MLFRIRSTRMNLPLKPNTLLAVALFSLSTVVPFLGPTETSRHLFALELELASDEFGYVQVYYDRGNGFMEAESSRLGVLKTEKPTALQLPLPIGIYRQLRLDPTDRYARLSFRNVRIVQADGRVIHRFAPTDFSALQQIDSLVIDGDTVRLSTVRDAEDPILGVALPRQLELKPPEDTWRYLRRSLLVFVSLCALLLIGSLAPTRLRHRTTERTRRIRKWLVAHPSRAVALIATLAVVLSCYPVIFLGKSFVSPNFSDGTHLLYGQFPTLPGHADAITEDARGSDVGAIIWQQVPYSFQQNRALLRDGELPLWNRYASCGTVLFGQGQSMLGDPLHLLVIIADGASWAWDLKYLAARWLLCFGLGAIVLRCTQHLPSALLAALAAAFLGFFTFRMNHPAYFSFCYAPWVLYPWLRIVEANTMRRVAFWCAALIAANFVEMHSGTVKEAYMLLVGLNFSGVCVLLSAARPWRERLWIFGAAIWAGVIFVLLTAPTWWTFLGSLRYAYTAYGHPTAYQISPSVLLGLFDEVFYRPLQSGERVFNPSANFLVLAGVLYFLATFREAARSPAARGLAWSALLPLAIAFGLIPPQWLVKVPFIANVAHLDNTFSCVLIILLVVLAGFGWQAAFTRLGSSEAGGDLARVGCAFALLVFSWVAFTHVVHRPAYGEAAVVSLLRWGQSVSVSSFVWLSLIALPLACIALFTSARRASLRGRWSAAGVIMAVLGLTVVLWRHGMHGRSVGPAEFVFTPSTRANFHATSAAIEALKADQREPGRVVGLGDNLFPGWSAVYDLEGLSGADALQNPYYRELIDALGLTRIWDWRIYTTLATLAKEKPALDFLNVRYYLDLHSSQQQLGAIVTPVKMADLDIYRSETAWPRAFFTSGVLVYDKVAELAGQIHRSGGRPFAAMAHADVLKSAEISALVVPTAAADHVLPAVDYRLTANSTEFTIEAPVPGIAVLHETWLPKNFVATVNGQSAPVLRVNHAFRGVPISAPGTYRVKCTHEPRRFTTSLVLAAAGVFLAGASGLFVYRCQRRASAASS